ncbi:RHS repeat protein [Pseudomonas cannabina pv. alisalensis]|nr:RHS repeat protein [Pseudomonas cannabina pv. alisalensis]QHF00209.1 RHS repeat protein [Pseudomonas syringae pv. maculicola str. ES4326]QQN24727.1 RHS repeat protein [Pseudomonas cannabina pv. alisalensis]
MCSLLFGLVYFLICSEYLSAASYTYRPLGKEAPYGSAIAACVDAAANAAGWNRYPQSNHSVFPARAGNGSVYYKCYFDIVDTITTGGIPQRSTIGPWTIVREGESCSVGSALDSIAGECISSCSSISQTLNKSTRECGLDEQKGTPPVNSCVGNPINVAVGNKFQVETDYQFANAGGMSFVRSYNSLERLWRHSYSTFIRFAEGGLSLVHADGRETFFNVVGGVAISAAGEAGSLVRFDDVWVYRTPNREAFTFDSTGRLVEWINPNSLKLTLAYVGSQVIVTSDAGQILRFVEDSRHQPLSLTAPDVSVDYIYDGNNNLASLTRIRSSVTEQRRFFYDDTRNVGLLTGITDERGVRFATWSYDDKGRAISSQHSDGAGLTRIAYNSDGSSTVTNELGKSTVYRYQQIGGVKRVTAIEGELSANCPASNSSYSYDEKGQMLTKTDAKGLITTYAYNDRGLEISRTEASGTTLARITTTEWDPDRFLPVKVIEPNRVTVYSYDNQGRELTRQSTSR